MKRYLLFAGVFVLSYLVLEVLAGMLLTMMYVPDIISNSREEVVILQTEVAFGGSRFFPTLVIALLSLATAFGVTTWLMKRAG